MIEEYRRIHVWRVEGLEGYAQVYSLFHEKLDSAREEAEEKNGWWVRKCHNIKIVRYMALVSGEHVIVSAEPPGNERSILRANGTRQQLTSFERHVEGQYEHQAPAFVRS